MGLRDVTLGVDTLSAAKQPSAQHSVENYLSSLGNLEGVESVSVQGLRAFHLNSDVLTALSGEISDIIAELVSSINADS